MATTDWKQSFSIKKLLFEEPYYFEFHQAIKVLENLYPNASHLGESPHIQNEITCLSSRTAYAYSPSDIDQLEFCNTTLQPLRMQVNFFGLAGANGPLPMPFTEQLIRDNQNGNYAMQDFIDVFNHRLLSIFHRIRKKYWIGLTSCSPQHSPVARILYALCGLGLESLQNRLHIHDRSFFNCTSIIWQQPPSPSGLEIIIKNHYGVPVSVQPWQGKWISIDIDQQTSLGRCHSQLSQSAALGQHFWDQMRTVQLMLGPLNWQQFNAFLPKAELNKSLNHIIQFYLGINYDVRYQLIINSVDIAKLSLGNNTRLGWTTWLHTTASPRELVVNI